MSEHRHCVPAEGDQLCEADRAGETVTCRACECAQEGAAYSAHPSPEGGGWSPKATGGRAFFAAPRLHLAGALLAGKTPPGRPGGRPPSPKTGRDAERGAKGPINTASAD